MGYKKDCGIDIKLPKEFNGWIFNRHGLRGFQLFRSVDFILRLSVFRQKVPLSW